MNIILWNIVCDVALPINIISLGSLNYFCKMGVDPFYVQLLCL